MLLHDGTFRRLLNQRVDRGNFTATLALGSGTVAQSVSAGFYERVGNIVHVTANIGITASTTPGGNLTVTGLPYASQSTTSQQWSFSMTAPDGSDFLVSAADTIFHCFLGPGTSTLKIISIVQNTGGAGSAGANIASGARGAVITGMYRTTAA